MRQQDMNAENFAEIIKNPSLLYQMPYQELKSLVLQYPYCRNLHYLLLQKNYLEQRGEFDQTLEHAATYSIDRRFLYRELKENQPEAIDSDSFELAEDYLELKDIGGEENELPQIELEKLNIRTSEFDATDKVAQKPFRPAPFSDKNLDVFEADLPNPAPVDIDDIPIPVMEIPQRPNVPGTKTYSPPGALLENGHALLSWLENRVPFPPGASTPSAEVTREDDVSPPPMEKVGPLPKSSFSSWKRQTNPSRIRTVGPAFKVRPAGSKKKKKKKKKLKKAHRIIAFAEKSLRENKEVASETLAELLVSQERYEKAIQMYERLILIFPEKSSFFAEKIAKLKKYV